MNHSTVYHQAISFSLVSQNSEIFNSNESKTQQKMLSSTIGSKQYLQTLPLSNTSLIVRAVRWQYMRPIEKGKFFNQQHKSNI